MFYKIDPELLGGVAILQNEFYVDAIVYYSDNSIIKKIIGEYKVQILGEYPFIKAVAVRVNKQNIFDLASNLGVRYVAKVAGAQIMMDKSRKIINVDELHRANINGKGINIAIIDTGCYPHLDFVLGKNRIIKFVDFINERTSTYDDNGHGTFVAGVLAGNGLVANAKFCGIAPNSGLVILKALKNDGQTQAYKVLEAMQWVFDNHKKYNIRVVCMSFGSTPLAQNDPLSVGANALWQKGIVVVSAVGNDGPLKSSVKSPGSSAKIITVGSADTTSNELKVADFSSRGPIFDFIKPDLIAPGVGITATSNDTKFYRQMSGTSVSTPFVAGVAALLLQKNPLLLPNDIKTILLASTTKLPFDANECGAGLLNAKNSNIFVDKILNKTR